MSTGFCIPREGMYIHDCCLFSAALKIKIQNITTTEKE